MAHPGTRSTLFLLWALACVCGDNRAGSAIDAGPDAGDIALSPGDDRIGWVSCGDAACSTGAGDTVCCYEDEPAGECISPRIACGVDEQGFGCDGPEDCAANETCCLFDDRTGWCHQACAQDTLCHTRADCDAHETCESIARGYARCTSSDQRGTPGHDGAGVVFCGSELLVCSDGEICCVRGSDPRCAVGCESDELARRCDGPEDCDAPNLCAIEAGATRCIDPTGMSTDGEPFVCHDSEDCSGYGCEPRQTVPELGFCNPNTGT